VREREVNLSPEASGDRSVECRGLGHPASTEAERNRVRREAEAGVQAGEEVERRSRVEEDEDLRDLHNQRQRNPDMVSTPE